MDAVRHTLRGFPALFCSRLKGAFPTIFFYILQFLLVSVLFGQRYIIVITCSTTLFQLRHKQYNSPWGLYPHVPGIPAALPAGLCRHPERGPVRAAQSGGSGGSGVLEEQPVYPQGVPGLCHDLRVSGAAPPTPEEFPTLFLATLFCSVLLLPALRCTPGCPLRPPTPAKQLEASLLRLARLLERLARLLERLAREGDDAAARKELYDAAQTFHLMGHNRRRMFRLPDRERRYYHLFALLFQRASYLVTDEAAWLEARQNPAFPQVMDTLSRLIRRLQETRDPAGLEELAGEVQELLDRSELPQGRLRIFYRSVLHMLLLLCREPLSATRPPYRLPSRRELWMGLRQRLSPESFEFRFALRLAVVLSVSCTVSFLWDFEHTYWFPLHAFLLLQPSYEESAHRMVTRPVGTAIGCLLVHLVYPYLPGLPGVFVFSLAMIALMYCCTPGTWVHPSSPPPSPSPWPLSQWKRPRPSSCVCSIWLWRWLWCWWSTGSCCPAGGISSLPAISARCFTSIRSIGAWWAAACGSRWTRPVQRTALPVPYGTP